MVWIAFAKSDSAAFRVLEADYARRRKKVVAADYHACAWKTAGVAPVLMLVAQKCEAVLRERLHRSKDLKHVA
ncbi:hypothetical protein [Mesorhizobium sp.]|uniref:hypothetical protein n=1 Tax=Mesorhizobium sp. TaxID=1871066 RepID=UPI000FE653D0|nr:hypothetical protein [Mesorhizobium sp.]RWM26576.1 MAG: hypothetical protein EOR74_14535 [Mesorhizobium sp.]RWM42537.1 MAG: hypothetical protein EOR75_01320 [Mesorhizobium sp.]TJV52996.1 MAG: hypothetical protein E5Y01_07270 [Mesorhizobium sp.]